MTNCKSYGYLLNVMYVCGEPIGLLDVEAPRFSRQSAHRGEVVSRFAPAALYPSQEDSWYSFLLEVSRHQGHGAAESIRLLEKSNDLNGNRTRDLPVCSIVPQSTTLPRAPIWKTY
jgi:hypothetical protein